jgi:ribosome-binding protein aMBF1 (putative translation factor)
MDKENTNIKIWDETANNITSLDENDKTEIDLISIIIEKRTELGLSQRDLAKLTEIKQPAIARMESFRATPTLRTLIIITKALDLEIKLE